MVDPLPAGTRFPDPRNVVAALYDMGWRVTVYTDPASGPMHNDPLLPDNVWLEALRRAGMHPLPCVNCYTSGDGAECIAGRCKGRASRLILPPQADFRAPR